MKTMIQIGAVLFLLALPVATNAATRVYDLTADFSAVQNPNCVWSYGWTQSRGSTFNLFTEAIEVTEYGIARFWYNPNVNSLGVGIAVTDYTHPTLFIPAGTLNLHPGPSGENAVIRWTAPSTGTSTIQGRFKGNDFAGPTTTDVAILRGGAAIFTGVIGSYNVPLHFAVTVQVNAGDTIDFTVGNGNGSYLFDSTGISATVSHDSVAPPPSCAGCSSANFAAAANFSTGTSPLSVAVGDFNLDGKPDMATANPGSNNVTILLGNGLGSFIQPAGSPVGAGSQPYSVAVSDFNLDGKPDLATANRDSNNVTILLGNGLGGFTQPAGSPFGVGTRPQSVAVGDFNLDGKPDLATANFNSSNVTILLGSGLGGFAQPADLPVGAGIRPLSVAVGDFNLDGKPDLATANINANVTILLGNGLGGFTQPAGSPFGGAGVVLQSVAVGDFNLDGKPDLATPSANSDNVTILQGDGLGGFTQPAGSPVSVGDDPNSVAVGDFNLDGKPDLATANFDGANVTILLGNGMGGFTQPAGSPVGSGNAPYSVAVGDFNLDGKPDLATANVLSNNVSVRLNTCTVNTSPTAVDDSYSTNESTPLNQTSPGVLANDTDGDNGTLTATLVSGPTNAASFNLNSNGSFTYTPNANFSGMDSFTYRAFDGELESNTATVQITVIADADADGVPNANDNCPNTANPDQLDTDGDGIGNACDPTPNGDTDDDGVDNNADNCPLVANADQINTDGDALGNACDPDDDNDGFSDVDETTAGSDPLNANSRPEVCDGVDNDLNEGIDEGFTNTDGDSQADCVDTDDDNDGQSDADEQSCGSNPLDANNKSTDTDNDGIPNCVDIDDDGDGVPDNNDNCPLAANPNQANADGDALGDVCDPDDDNDGIHDGADNCPLTANPNQTDTDGDGQGNVCDADDDGDGVLDGSDNCSLTPNSNQSDTDGDGIGDACDPAVIITSPPSGAVYQIGSTINFAGSFTDNDGDTHTAQWTFTSSGNSSTQAGTVNEINKTVGASRTFNSPGVYLISLSVTDNSGNSGTATTVNNDLQAMVVIYDPNGGFVTGGGWIDSPAGAYRPNESLTGRASFGFVSKYQNGAGVPTGNTEFQFRAANFNFASTSYEWLVIGGARAQYKGFGTINGSGNYRFMLTAIDGQRNGGGGVDKFRVKIWDNSTGGIIYDNQVGGDTSDNADPNTALGGGSIVIHRP